MLNGKNVLIIKLTIKFYLIASLFFRVWWTTSVDCVELHGEMTKAVKAGRSFRRFTGSVVLFLLDKVNCGVSNPKACPQFASKQSDFFKIYLFLRLTSDNTFHKSIERYG
jgi:hypothetical protein